MKLVADLGVMLNNVSATGPGPSIPIKGGRDTFEFFAVTTGATANLTVTIELLSPDGTNWHEVAQIPITSVGPQPMVRVGPMVSAEAIRANVTTYNSGSVTVRALGGAINRD